ncbi:MAG: hypothetical protein HN900_21285 [Gammaproteobacteria bacterium]|nr:hypothetical protein [Gammaproteobacteria bacterium]MBT3866979.1 hypothetical protein [Gammaproteobacteria bacterium]MBT4380298.1 hypothetical protein [Gammaproteobacteria bacterium]MBT5199284.1 hypothetical protein [Gammaproteobacteria bacterium]MBT5443010.1 hypothetical protein [Gammaproteobacteria bacterium]
MPDHDHAVDHGMFTRFKGNDFHDIGICQSSAVDWGWVMGVNFQGVLYGLQAFVPHMLEHGEAGHIVNTNIIEAERNRPAGLATGADPVGPELIAMGQAVLAQGKQLSDPLEFGRVAASFRVAVADEARGKRQFAPNWPCWNMHCSCYRRGDPTVNTRIL